VDSTSRDRAAELALPYRHRGVSAASAVTAREERSLGNESKRRTATSPAFGAGLENLMGYNLRRAHGVQKARFAAVFGPLGVRPVTLSVLGTVCDNPGITQADLGKRLNIKRANMVGVMVELEGRGLIARRPSTSDRRAHVVALTASGRRFTVKVLALHGRLEEDLVLRLGLRERDQLLALLKRFRRLAPEPDLTDLD
jgi:DNA-binding MarR family transcriptional regulator